MLSTSLKGVWKKNVINYLVALRPTSEIMYFKIFFFKFLLLIFTTKLLIKTNVVWINVSFVLIYSEATPLYTFIKIKLFNMLRIYTHQKHCKMLIVLFIFFEPINCLLNKEDYNCFSLTLNLHAILVGSHWAKFGTIINLCQLSFFLIINGKF